MATLLDIGLIQGFSQILPFLFALFLGYAILTRLEIFGKENKLSAVMIAFILAVVVLISPVASRVIELMLPNFVLFMLGVFFIMLMMMVLGAKESTISGYIFEGKKEGAWVSWTVGVISMLIFLRAFFVALAEAGRVPGVGGAVSGSAQEQAVYAILFHPQVMGMIFVMVIAIFTVNRLTSQ